MESVQGAAAPCTRLDDPPSRLNMRQKWLHADEPRRPIETDKNVWINRKKWQTCLLLCTPIATKKRFCSFEIRLFELEIWKNRQFLFIGEPNKITK